MSDWLLPAALGLTGLLVGAAGMWAWRRKTADLHITNVLHVNVNCSDFERSRVFYERLGFKVLMHVAPDGAGDVAAAVGMARYRVRGALMSHRDGTTLDLLEWQEPSDAQRPSADLHRLGIARIALTTRDLDADVASLRASGVRFLSERPGAVPDSLGGTSRFICFLDPDGAVLELVEMGGLMGAAYRLSRLIPRL